MEINDKNPVPCVFSVAVYMAAVAECDCNHHACRCRDGIRLFNVEDLSCEPEATSLGESAPGSRTETTGETYAAFSNPEAVSTRR
jgi:hypothetical protein